MQDPAETSYSPQSVSHVQHVLSDYRLCTLLLLHSADQRLQGRSSVPVVPVASGGAWGANNGNAFDSVPATIAVDREAGV